MNGFYLVVDAPYVVHATQNEVDHYVWGVYKEDVKLFLKYPGNYTYWAKRFFFFQKQCFYFLDTP